MKRRQILLLVFLAAVLVISLARIGGLDRFDASTGRCVITDSGDCMLVLGSTPVELHGNRDSFTGLRTGDKLLVIHDGINETWPAQTTARFCLKIGSGSIADIPQDVLAGLRDHGWIRG